MSAIGLSEWRDHTSTSDEYLRAQEAIFLLICRSLDNECPSSMLTLGFVSWSCFNAKADFKVTSEVGDMG